MYAVSSKERFSIMRWMLILAVLSLGLPAQAQENEGEKLYRKAEQQIRSAKGLKVVFEVNGGSGNDTAKTMGYMMVAEGNKARLEIKTTIADTTQQEQIVADGKESALLEGGKVVGQRLPVDPASAEAALAIVIRAGVLAVLQIAPEPKTKFDIDKILPMSEFKLGAKEMVGSREAQVVTYKLAPPLGEPLQITLWLDTKTDLPIKRMTLGKVKDVKSIAVEVYTEVGLNPTFDAKIFELPK
jgi:outer membrane lipoprotein-sorting protein